MNTMRNNKRSAGKLIKALAASAACIASLTVANPVHAVDFDGERVEWIIPFKEGGGSDTWARFFAPLISENLPGKPAIVVKNIPGGGSTKGANQFQRKAKDNGLNIIGTSGSTQFPYLLGDTRVNYDYKNWTPVLASPTGGVFYVSPELGIKSAAELASLRGKELKYASQGATSLDLVPLLAMDILDIDVQAIFGMKGRGAGRLAFERGEVNVDYQTSSAYLKKVVPLVDEGKVVPIMSWGVLDEDGNLQRDPNFPDLPHFAEVYEMIHGKKPEGTAFKVWKAFFAAGFAAQKGIFLPKGTPQDVIDAWGDAVEKTVKADDFKSRSELVLGDYPQAVKGKAVKAFKAALDISDADREWVRNWLTSRYNVQL
ncbi:Tripartite-type tricarboxylate transporter, receptor component TctC [Amphritea atlantica]|uniref:Tripartite-type tricarboxylate transporter, receptor component TctC n=1 Tax=Amphritea atlantica TaxID=355243 RepID=A0A1H9EX48_9GAMM|nr:tripartite tricarboxylate transporter substrate-binding protein [Amphritea atlantica]SEQ30346.1 Tripartite-type tricarboxylate transporter, receptor component TctC [Amphritea atlantica]